MNQTHRIRVQKCRRKQLERKTQLVLVLLVSALSACSSCNTAPTTTALDAVGMDASFPTDSGPVVDASDVLGLDAGIADASSALTDAATAMDANAVPLRDAGADGGMVWSTPSELYDPDGRFYSYAPSAFSEAGVDRIWTCHNHESDVVRDYIYFTEIATNGVVVSRPVLFPGPAGAWDSYNVCDPSVIEGQFIFSGTTYRYALFYTGNDIQAVNHCQVGVAFSTDLGGGGTWVRYPSPIVTWPPSDDWGVGQPSAVSLDGRGRVLLFYTQGTMMGVHVNTRELDLSDMSQPVIGTEVQLSDDGVLGWNGAQDVLCNVDAAYDPIRDRFIVVTEQHPFPQEMPNWLVTNLQLLSIKAVHVRDGFGSWRVEGVLDAPLTGLPRNHNAGIFRTLQGALPVANRVRVAFTETCEGCQFPAAMWGCDIWTVEGSF